MLVRVGKVVLTIRILNIRYLLLVLFFKAVYYLFL